MAKTSESGIAEPASIFTINDASMNIDEGMRHSGCGTFHILLQVIVMYYVLVAAYVPWLSYFMMDDPPWTCVFNGTINLNNTFCSKNFGKSFRSDSSMFNERCKLQRNEWKYITANTYSVVTEFDLVCESQSLTAISSSSVFAGAIVGVIIAGIAADVYGRKPVMVISLLVQLCASVGCAYACNVWELSVLRSILGAAYVSCYNTVEVYLLELAEPRFRASLGILINMAATFSLLIVDGVAYAERHWRNLQMYVTYPAIAAIVMFLWLPESPRWLLANNKVNKAEIIVAKAAKYNGKVSTPISLKSVCTTQERRYTYIDLFRTWKLFHLTLVTSLLYMAIVMIYFTIGLDSSKLGGGMYQVFAFMTLADLPCTPASIYLTSRFGRKNIVLCTILLAGICIGSIALIPRSHHVTHILSIILAALGKSSIDISYIVIDIWNFELYPTVIRLQGYSVTVVFNRVGGLAAPFLVNMLQSVNYKSPFIVMFFVALAAFSLGLSLPETKNMRTREVVEDLYKVAPDIVVSDNDGYGNREYDTDA